MIPVLLVIRPHGKYDDNYLSCIDVHTCAGYLRLRRKENCLQNAHIICKNADELYLLMASTSALVQCGYYTITLKIQ